MKAFLSKSYKKRLIGRASKTIKNTRDHIEVKILKITDKNIFPIYLTMKYPEHEEEPHQ